MIYTFIQFNVRILSSSESNFKLPLQLNRIGHFMFSGELTEFAVTFADIDKFYWNLVICRLDVVLFLSVKHWGSWLEK